ncbi:MAG: hypothetical protein A3J79_00170 [Elusimicrobia bacterium RIFOXYB2_FULL_62_6]|nr:MAG: hypothetical protein A3J79_00170 [Elusimicrobia bacterium RIFOXYB2_FULL_62_6]
MATKADYDDVRVDTTTIANNVAGKETADTAIVKEADLTANDFNAVGNVVSIDYTNGQAAATGVKGFLTGSDWDTFNGKLSPTGNGSGLTGIITSTQVIMTTLGNKLDATGDGSGLSGVITSTDVIVASLATKAIYNDVRVDTTTIANSVAGKETADTAIVKEADLTANDFNAVGNVVSIDYTNGQAAATGVKGFLTGADWDTFNGKLSPTGNGSGLTGIITSTQVIITTLGNKLDTTGDGSGLSGVITSTDVIVASLATKAVYNDVRVDTTTIANSVATKADYEDVRVDTTTIANNVAAKAGLATANAFLSSQTITDARGLYAHRHMLGDNVEISSTSSAYYGGISISSNVYLALGAKYYGNGSGLSSLTAASISAGTLGSEVVASSVPAGNIGPGTINGAAVRIQNLVIETLAEDPATPLPGQIWLMEP